MRYNKHELIALASQTSQSFEREGVLVVRERQDSFFRRSEGCSARWFRLRGNLLFYLKGPEPWYEPMGLIVLGHHQIKIQDQDENGHWPFHIVWENGVCFRLSAHAEGERSAWAQALRPAAHEALGTRLAALSRQLQRLRPELDIRTHRMQKGIVTDMGEVPLCELALSCDNLLCDALGRAPSPRLVVYATLHRGLRVRYGCTEVVETCSNPCFAKTVVFRASDGLSGDTVVRLAAYDVREPVTDTAVPMGHTTMRLATIQEAQRLRVALVSLDNKPAGFVTVNGWCVEPAAASPARAADRTSADSKALAHRRSQSLPPRLGMRLKSPPWCAVLRQALANSFHATYRFHSGLGGDITVHEVMAEPRICYHLPAQLLDIYMRREKELLSELVSVGEAQGAWRRRRARLAAAHVALLRHYCHARRRMLHADTPCFKPSCKKDDASLAFAPTNMHVQRMWVHDDALDKSSHHDVVTAGAFAAHAHKAERNGGLIRLVQAQQSAPPCAGAARVSAERSNAAAAARLATELAEGLERAALLAQARRREDTRAAVDDVKSKTKSMLSLYDPVAIAETLSFIEWPKDADNDDVEWQVSDSTMSSIMRLTEQITLCDSDGECGGSSSSSKEASPTGEMPALSASVPDVGRDDVGLMFQNDYFDCDRNDRLNHSFRSVRSGRIDGFTIGRSLEIQKPRAASLRHEFRSSASLEQVSYRCLVEKLAGDNGKTWPDHLRDDSTELPPQEDEETRRARIEILRAVAARLETAVADVAIAMEAVLNCDDTHLEPSLDLTKSAVELVRARSAAAARWLRRAHAALRLRCEPPQATRAAAALQTRRDACFAQALTTATTGLSVWVCTAAPDTVHRLLSSGLGPLCGFEGLLSLYAAERAMWGDMVVAVEDVQPVVFRLAKFGHSNASLPQVTGSRGSLIVHIPVSEALYNKFTNKEHLSFTVTAVFFNIGINDKATLAEALGETAPQHHSNRDNYDRLYKYYQKYSKLFHEEISAARAPSGRGRPLEEVMEALRAAVLRRPPKNTEVLHLAAMATRQMNGVRVTSCKSAKDRTGMAVTLEQAAVLAADYHLAGPEASRAKDVMRSEGCRRENTFKNIGVRKYAFTKKQVSDLPPEYRPPPGTYGSTQT